MGTLRRSHSTNTLGARNLEQRNRREISISGDLAFMKQTSDLSTNVVKFVRHATPEKRSYALIGQAPSRRYANGGLAR